MCPAVGSRPEIVYVALRQFKKDSVSRLYFNPTRREYQSRRARHTRRHSLTLCMSAFSSLFGFFLVFPGHDPFQNLFFFFFTNVVLSVHILFERHQLLCTGTQIAALCCSGGNSRTAMVAALSPADINYDETLSTLR